jgi:hypothetical protein
VLNLKPSVIALTKKVDLKLLVVSTYKKAKDAEEGEISTKFAESTAGIVNKLSEYK